MMTRSRRSLYLTFSGLVGLALTLTVTTCGGEKFSQTPTSPSASGGGGVNAGMVAGTGTCQYSATPTAFDVALPGQGGDSFGIPADCTGISCLFDIPVTVTGVAADGGRCTWGAESSLASNVPGPAPWITIEGAMTGNGLIPALNDAVMVEGNGTVQFSLEDEFANNIGIPPEPEFWPEFAIDCRTFDATDYIMNPVTVDFDYAGGAGQPITVEVAPPKTREGVILIREQGSNILLFTIPVVQHGSVCSWYLKPVNCTYVPNGTCTDPITLATPESDWISVDGGIIDGSGTASFSVSAGDVPAGSLAPRDGVIMLYDESLDYPKGMLYITQLGEPAEDEEPECSYNYAISQSVFEYPGGTAELTVVASPSTCGWHAEASAASEDWVSVSYTTAPCPGGVCYGTQQVQVVVQPGDVGSPPIAGPAGRSGAVIIYQEVGGTFEQLFTVPISQFR